jgi:23S rRNA pseudouridine1911/1915/1917 synthase
MDTASPTRTFSVEEADSGKRLDQFLVAALSSNEVSRARVQQLIHQQKVQVNGSFGRASLRLHSGDQVAVLGSAQPAPLKAVPEDIPLDIVYEDGDLAIVNKAAGMLVHAGAGERRGTLVNALLHRFKALSNVGGELRPGIVHRLDKETSGLMVVAKNDVAHRKLAEQFSERKVHKRYLALVHGWLKSDKGTIASAISRDRVRRTRMTTRRAGGREAVSTYRVLERIGSAYGKFTLLEVVIATGRTHQIRVHLASAGHPVVGDTLYGAPREIVAGPVLPKKKQNSRQSAALGRNFLHATAIELLHPRTSAPLVFERPLPQELADFLERIRRDKPESA